MSHYMDADMSRTQPSTAALQKEYWIPGYGLSRRIMLRQIQLFLGPAATIRPYSYQGREGYIINGTELTVQQIADLKRQSKEYERQETIRMTGRSTSSTVVQSEDADINQIVVVGNARKNVDQPSRRR